MKLATLDSVTTADLDGVCPHGYPEDARLDGRVWEAPNGPVLSRLPHIRPAFPG